MPDETTPTQSQDPNANTGGNGGTTQPQDTERKFTQADLDRAIAARLERERKTAEERTAKERTAAEQERLKAQSEWEELAKQHEQAVRDLTPQLETAQTRYSALAERLNKQIDTGIKDWPAEARRMVPSTDDIAARLDAYENMRGLLERGGIAARQPGNTPSPRPQAGPDARASTEQLLRANPRYSSI